MSRQVCAVTHETSDPVIHARPVDGGEIVRLAMEWRRKNRTYELDLHECWFEEQAEWDAFVTALDTRL
jgi:hypothetical protein